MSLGERFRAAREQRGLTLSDVAEQIRIRSVYLAAIEEENWSTIGAAVYVRGFLRTYARYLGLDPEEAVAAFNADAGAAAPPSVAPVSREFRAQGKSLAPLIWVASLVAAALVGFVIYLSILSYLTPPRAPQAATATASPLPGVTAGATPASAANAAATGIPGALASATPSGLPAPRTLAIHLTAPSWLRVTIDGNVSIEGTFPAGTTKEFHGKSALVRIGNAGGVEVTVDGKAVGKLGSSGDVVEKHFTL